MSDFTVNADTDAFLINSMSGANQSAIRTRLGLGTLSTLNSLAIDDLSDVTITSVASGELLKWNGSAWINNTLAEAGVSAVGHTHVLSDITDSGTIASQDANNVAITGGSVSGITDLAVADGGTGASTAAGARTNLGAAAASHTHTAEDLDFAGSTDIGADLADADEVLVSDGGGNTTRRKSALSRFWTYTQSKLDGNITIAGTKDFTGQVSLTGQTASDDDAAMTRSLVDARSGVNYYLKENGATTSNSTSYVNSSETVVLPAGTYRYSGTAFAYTASTTGGINFDIDGLAATERLHRYSFYLHTSTSTTLMIQATPVEDVLQVRTDTDSGVVCNGYMDGSTSDRQIATTCEGYFITGSEQTLRFRVAQRTATDASNPAIIKSAFVLFEKLA